MSRSRGYSPRAARLVDGVLFAPFRAGAAHIVQFRAIGIEDRARQTAQILQTIHQSLRRTASSN
jgi:hypothetical protein